MSKKKEKMVQELHPYKSGVFHWMPVGMKVILLKCWAAGIVFYFVGFGSPFLRPGSFGQIFSLGSILGLMNSYAVSRIVRDLARGAKNNGGKFNSVHREGPVGTLTHILLSLLIVFLTAYSYDFLNRLILILPGIEQNRVYLPAEPIGFALFYAFFDFLWRTMVWKIRSKTGSTRSDVSGFPEPAGNK